MRWWFEGNRPQFDINTDLSDSLKQVLWAINNEQLSYAKDIISEVRDKLHVRNKHRQNLRLTQLLLIGFLKS